MENFYTASAVYLGGSLLLFLLFGAMMPARRRLFARHFGPGRQVEQLNEIEQAEWLQLHDKTFNHGFWRFVALAFMFYHYPGFFACVAARRDLSAVVMVLVSAMVWLGLFYCLF